MIEKKNIKIPIYKLVDIFLGTKIVTNYNFLMKSQWWPKEKIKELQDKKLRKLINNSYENVPYYKKLFKENNLSPNDIQTIDDLHKIPILTKKIIRENSSDLIARNISPKTAIFGSTGGSTGEPLQFYYDKNSKSWAWGSMYRYFNWVGMKFGEKMFQFKGGSLGGFLKSRSKFQQKIAKMITGTVFLNAFELSEKKLDVIVSLIIKRDDINFLRGYPSVIYIFAKYLNNNCISFNNFKGVLTTAEKLFDFQKDEIRKAFNCEIFDQYGCGEIQAIAAQCEFSDMYHVFDEHVIVETITRNGFKNIALITDLDNYLFPFIRYENGDVIQKNSKDCKCGRKLTTLSSIDGRTHDYITTESGSKIAGEFFPHLFQTIKGINQYMIIQESSKKILLYIIPNEKFSENEIQKYIEKMKEYIGKSIEIEIIKTKEIPVSSSGKRFFIKSLIN